MGQKVTWGDGEGLSRADRRIVDKVETALADGLELYRWWQEAVRDRSFAERFRMFDQLERPDTNYGFIDEVTVGGSPLPVVGTVQEVLYARPKVPADAAPGQEAGSAEWMREQVRAFMLRYFLRVAAHLSPRLTPTTPREPPPAWLRPLSWCTGGPLNRRGWGYKQLYYKRRKSGEVGKFPESEQRAIVDVREIGDTYEWIVLEVNVFDFAMTLPPFSEDGARLSVPFKSVVQVVLSRDFVIDEDAPEEGVLGRYGWGYAFIRPSEPSDSLLGYGPDALGPAFMTFHFDVLQNGEAHLLNAFAANQPERLVNVSLNPFDWATKAAEIASFGFLKPFLAPLRQAARSLPGAGFFRPRPVFDFIDGANFLSGGLAQRELCISKNQLLKEVMAIHFLDVYHFILGTLETWNQIPDWTAAQSLPPWVVAGENG